MNQAAEHAEVPDLFGGYCGTHQAGTKYSYLPIPLVGGDIGFEADHPLSHLGMVFAACLLKRSTSANDLSRRLDAAGNVLRSNVVENVLVHLRNSS